MNATDIFAQPILIETLQLYKRLDPLTTELIDDLQRVAELNVTDFTEAEVRAYVIDPIVLALGYAKGTDFSVDLEHKIDFLGKKKFADYKFNLWRENFWLIEAKRPRNIDAFGYADLAQALEYAAHPDINAALVVLCDGSKLEIFDRESSITEPILRVKKEDLVSEFDKIRHLLEPWQLWFFQKRRLVRSIDKVFDLEFNMQRVEEFKKLINDRLVGKRTLIIENFRKLVSPDSQAERNSIMAASAEDLIEIHMFQAYSHPTTNTLICALADRSVDAGTFLVPYRMFSDKTRDISDVYVGHALVYLMELHRRGIENLRYLPKWLAPSDQMNADLRTAIGRLIKLCLSYFSQDEATRLVLLAAAAYRRGFKILLTMSEEQWSLAEARHFIRRFETPERSWNQIVSSPTEQLLLQLNASAMMATYHFVTSLQSENNNFKIEVAKNQLRQIWAMEKKLLEQIPNYPKISLERKLDEMHPTESCCINYDFLGHLCLCLLPPFPFWKEYIIKNHQPELETLARLGSWSARDLLNIDKEMLMTPLDDQIIADRFFLGDVGMLRFLRARYTGAHTS